MSAGDSGEGGSETVVGRDGQLAGTYGTQTTFPLPDNSSGVSDWTECWHVGCRTREDEVEYCEQTEHGMEDLYCPGLCLGLVMLRDRI